MRHLVTTIILLALLSVDARAQRIELDVDAVPLRQGLTEFREQTGIDLVFAEAVVDGLHTTCSYDGIEAERALECLLDGTGLRAERVRHRQYVLVAPQTAGSGEPVRRITLSGFVVDEQTGEALPGAHVYLPDLRLGTATNEMGYFVLPSLPVASYRARITFVGFDPAERTLSDSDGPQTVRLRPTTVSGGAIVVEGKDSRQWFAEVLPGMETESTSLLEPLPTLTGESDLLQALQWYPGIRSVGEVNGGMSVRGGSPDQNLYLIDGAPVYHPWHAFSLISTFQAETFKDFRLYRGSFPSRYGGRTSSVLEAKMKDGSRQEPHAAVGLSALSGRFLIETPATRNSSFMIAGRRSYLDKLVGREHPVENAEGRRDTLRTGYHFYDVSAKYSWRTSRRDRVSLSYYRGGDNLDLRLPFDLSLDFSSWLRPADHFFEVVHHWKNQLVVGRFQRVHSSKMFVTATGYYSSYDATEAAFLRPMSTAALRSNYRVDVKDVGFKLSGDYIHSVEHSFHVGAHVVVRDFHSALDAVVRRSPGNVDSKYQTSSDRGPEISVFAEDTWDPAERWTLVPGVRVSVFGSGLYSDVSPSLAFRYALHPSRLVINGGISRRVQYMHRLRDRHAVTYDLVSSRWVPASLNVRPSRAVDVSGGFESQPFTGLTLKGEAYIRNTDNVLLPEEPFEGKDELVGPGIGVSELLGQYVEGKARAYGIELSSRYQSRRWTLWVSYAGGRSLARSAELGEESFRPARYDVPRSLYVVGSRSIKKWRFTAAMDLRSGYPTTVPVARYGVGDPLDGETEYLYRPSINNGRLPAYFRLDLAAVRRFDLLGADWHLRLQVYNVTNRRNVIARHYLPADEGMVVQSRRGLPLLPLFELGMEL